MLGITIITLSIFYNCPKAEIEGYVEVWFIANEAEDLNYRFQKEFEQ